MLNTRRPSELELLAEYRDVLAEQLLQILRTEPDNLEKQDPKRLSLQATMFYLRKPAK